MYISFIPMELYYADFTNKNYTSSVCVYISSYIYTYLIETNSRARILGDETNSHSTWAWCLKRRPNLTLSNNRVWTCLNMFGHVWSCIQLYSNCTSPVGWRLFCTPPSTAGAGYFFVARNSQVSPQLTARVTKRGNSTTHRFVYASTHGVFPKA